MTGENEIGRDRHDPWQRLGDAETVAALKEADGARAQRRDLAAGERR